MRLTATRNFKYGTRRLQAGDEFDAPMAHGMLLVGYKKAIEQTNPEPARDESMDVLRRAARALGIIVDGRWGKRRLQSEIEAKSAQ